MFWWFVSTIVGLLFAYYLPKIFRKVFLSSLSKEFPLDSALKTLFSVPSSPPNTQLDFKISQLLMEFDLFRRRLDRIECQLTDLDDLVREVKALVKTENDEKEEEEMLLVPFSNKELAPDAKLEDAKKKELIRILRELESLSDDLLEKEAYRSLADFPEVISLLEKMKTLPQLRLKVGQIRSAIEDFPLPEGTKLSNFILSINDIEDGTKQAADLIFNANSGDKITIDSLLTGLNGYLSANGTDIDLKKIIPESLISKDFSLDKKQFVNTLQLFQNNPGYIFRQMREQQEFKAKMKEIETSKEVEVAFLEEITKPQYFLHAKTGWQPKTRGILESFKFISEFMKWDSPPPLNFEGRMEIVKVIVRNVLRIVEPAMQILAGVTLIYLAGSGKLKESFDYKEDNPMLDFDERFIHYFSQIKKSDGSALQFKNNLSSSSDLMIENK